MSDLRSKSISGLAKNFIPSKFSKIAFHPLFRSGMVYPWESGADTVGLGDYYDDMQARRQAAIQQMLDAEMYRRLLRSAIPAQQEDPVKSYKKAPTEDPVRQARRAERSDPVQSYKKGKPVE